MENVMFLYCLYDTVSKQFAPSFEQPNDPSAVRMFKNMCRQDSSISPSDYELYSLGSIKRVGDAGAIEVIGHTRKVEVDL